MTMRHTTTAVGKGLSPMQYESAGRRRDGSISREVSVALRRALIDLGLGLWLTEPAAGLIGDDVLRVGVGPDDGVRDS